ncbi:MAG TPA: SdpI family protein [Armatimonadota bacterium]|jgi:hypothetical protein
MLAILGAYVAIGGLFAMLGIPMAARRVPPNAWYGLRVQKTLKPGNERIWYEANAYCGRLMIWAGAITAICAVALRFVKGLSLDAYSLDCTAVMLAGLAMMIILSFRYLATLK